MNPARKLGCLLPLVMAWAAPAAMADTTAPDTATAASQCEVMASSILSNNDHIASYRGGCRNGRADGIGEARWTLRYGPGVAPLVWQGRFVDGIYLAEPEVGDARRLGGTTALLDLGPLALAPQDLDTASATPPVQTGHLWVASRAENKWPASACRPIAVHVSTDGPLADDAVARRWLDAAYQRWQQVCRASVAPPGPTFLLRVALHEGSDWQPDARGNLPAGVVQAYTLPGAATPSPTANWQGYHNRAAQQRAAALHQEARRAALQANEARLRDFARSHGAKRYLALAALQQNPFRFGDEVLLLSVRLLEARTPFEAVVRSTSQAGGRGLLLGDIAQWDNAGRMVAVRIVGRAAVPGASGLPVLQLIDSRVCDSDDCHDYLALPGSNRPGEWLLE